MNKGAVFVAPLLSPGGNPKALSHCPGNLPFSPTPALERCPYFQHVLDSFPCPKLSARLIRLPAGHGLSAHRDNWRGFRFGILRLHVPVVTRRGVDIRIGGESFFWRAGETWYGEFSEEHEVANASGIARVHLVIDVQITRALLALFPKNFRKNTPAKQITFSPKPIRLSAANLRRFECEFDLPRGFVPSAREIRLPSVRARIQLSKAGTLSLKSPGYGQLALTPIDSSTLIPEGIGAGNRFRLLSSHPRKARLEIFAKGVLQKHPVTGRVVPADLRHICEASRTSGGA